MAIIVSTKALVENKEKLIEYGFIKVDHFLELRKTLFSNVIGIIKIEDNEIIAYAEDLDFPGEQYPIPSESKAWTALDHLVQEVIDTCYTKPGADNEKLNEIINYIREKYKVEPNFKFEKHPDIRVWLTKKQKWFAAYQLVKANKIGIPSDDLVGILNVKVVDTNIVDNKTIFPGYHFNKKYWVSLIVDDRLKMDLFKLLIDDSYDLVNKK